METKSIMIVGVGGQGTLLASRLIGNALISTGCDVKLSEPAGRVRGDLREVRRRRPFAPHRPG